MATTNLTLTGDWTLIADDTQEFTFGVSDGSPVSQVAIAAMATEVAPEITGQVMATPVHQVNRALTGPGFIYARALGSVSLSAWLHSWTE